MITRLTVLQGLQIEITERVLSYINNNFTRLKLDKPVSLNIIDVIDFYGFFDTSNHNK